MSDALLVTEEVLAAVVKDCVAARPQEACGFVVARRGEQVGSMVRTMRNVDPDPRRGYLMDDQEVLAAYAEFDAAGFEPVAVYHSHVASPPLMSARDSAQAADTTLAYMIVSLAGDSPRARAYRVARPFVGVATAREVNIKVATDDPAPTVEGPWALTEGNEVAITYSRPRVTSTTTVMARVIACGAGGVGLEPLTANQRNVPVSLPLDRIRQVEVLRESPAAVALRRSLWGEARYVVATLRDGGDLTGIPNIAAALHEAFPTTMRVVVRETEEKP